MARRQEARPRHSENPRTLHLLRAVGKQHAQRVRSDDLRLRTEGGGTVAEGEAGSAAQEEEAAAEDEAVGVEGECGTHKCTSSGRHREAEGGPSGGTG